MRLYGKNPVIERLKFDPRSIQRIYIETGHADSGYVHKKAKKAGIAVCSVPRSKIQKLARNLNTQGILAEVGDFPYVEYDDLLEQALKKNLVLVFLDGLNDPQNFGGILRSCACFGGFAVVLPTHDSVDVTETVLRVACGGENYVPIAKVANLGRALEEAKDKGFWIAGTVVADGENVCDTKLQFPLGVVIGSEQKGIRAVIRKLIDQALTLPMAQPRMSLNAAHAASVFCYEIMLQKNGKK